MDKPWYQKLFSRPQDLEAKSTRAKADDGDAEAQFSLGLRYAHGEGEARDYVQAARWYLKAAQQNHVLAQFNLGVMYTKGQGVPKDSAQAVIWMRKAAHQGDPGAQFDLGMRYHFASIDGKPMDGLESKVEAYKWLHLAAAQGYKGSASACEFVNLTMTHEEVADGNRRAAAFVAESPDTLESSDPLPASLSSA